VPAGQCPNCGCCCFISGYPISCEQRESLRRVRDQIKLFSDQCEKAEYTDPGDMWCVLIDAYNAIDWLFTPRKGD
jgi:hypothetical protein